MWRFYISFVRSCTCVRTIHWLEIIETSHWMRIFMLLSCEKPLSAVQTKQPISNLSWCTIHSYNFYRNYYFIDSQHWWKQRSIVTSLSTNYDTITHQYHRTSWTNESGKLDIVSLSDRKCYVYNPQCNTIYGGRNRFPIDEVLY